MAASVVASVALPISNNFSFAPSMDAYGKLSEYGKLGAWSPLSLFAASEVGAWYDPSDLTTMFQDSAGTTPVTADGQPVGLILDKSTGLALGAEQAVNGDFNSGTGWSLVGASISGGNLTFSSSALNDYASNSGGISAANVLFEITFTITSIASGSVRPQAGGKVGTVRTSAGTYSERIVSVSGAALAIVAASANTTAVISDISLKVVTGNHATQATAASRPLYKTDGTYHWLQFDGVDDSLSTAAIDFTGTDKIGVFSGIKKTSDAVVRVAVELGTNAYSSTGFNITAPRDSPQPSYGFSLYGTALASYAAKTFTAPNTSVLSCQFDMAGALIGDEIKPRGNGGIPTLEVQNAGPAGSINFANSSLYVGSRSNGALFMYGNIYSLIIRGALSTTQEITDTETWVNQRTGAY